MINLSKYDPKKLNIKSATTIFNYIISSSKDNIGFLGKLNKELQIELLCNEENINKLINANIKDEYLTKLDGKVISYLLNYNYFANLFLSYNIDNINIIMKKGIIIPRNLLCNSLIKKYIDIKDINRYRNYVDNITDINLKSLVEEQRKKEYLNMINNIDNDLLPVYQEIYNKVLNNESITYFKNSNSKVYYDILAYKNNSANLLCYLKDLSSKEILEIIIDMYFKDIAYNFIINIKSLLTYIENTKSNLIDVNNLNIYKKIYNYYNLTTQEKIELFNSLNKEIDYVSMFYDDFYNIKKESYQKIKDNLIDFSKEEYTLINNIPVYKKDGDNFYLLISHTLWGKDIEHYNNYSDNDTKTYSMSIISHNNLMTFRNPKSYVILGFDIDINKIIHLYESDSFSDELNGSDRIQRIFTIEELVSKTKGYNEILVNNNSIIKPSYVVVYDEIMVGDIALAKKYNIPIVLINTKKYSNNKTKLDILGDKYEDSYSASYLDVDAYQRMLVKNKRY